MNIKKLTLQKAKMSTSQTGTISTATDDEKKINLSVIMVNSLNDCQNKDVSRRIRGSIQEARHKTVEFHRVEFHSRHNCGIPPRGIPHGGIPHSCGIC